MAVEREEIGPVVHNVAADGQGALGTRATLNSLEKTACKARSLKARILAQSPAVYQRPLADGSTANELKKQLRSRGLRNHITKRNAYFVPSTL